MNDAKEGGYLAAIFLIVMCGAILFFSVVSMQQNKINELRSQMVERNAARWETNTSGQTTFVVNDITTGTIQKEVDSTLKVPNVATTDAGFSGPFIWGPVLEKTNVHR